MTRSPADVVMIGAGVVGAAIARTLAAYSLELVLVDAAPDVEVLDVKAMKKLGMGALLGVAQFQTNPMLAASAATYAGTAARKATR